jgi:hypothetical protein
MLLFCSCRTYAAFAAIPRVVFMKASLTIHATGFCAVGDRDGTVHASHCAPSIHDSSKNVYFYVCSLLHQTPTCAHNPNSSQSPLVAKMQYGMKITFIFILILFIDSVNRVYRVQVELAETNKNAGGYVSHAINSRTLINSPVEQWSWAMSVWRCKHESSTLNATCTSVVSLSSSP